jgi:hypothetical protein
MAALMTVWPSSVIRQRRERGTFATRPHVKPVDEAGDLRAATTVGHRGGAKQPRAHVAVAKALQRVLATEHRREESEVGRGGGSEGAGGSTMGIAHRLHEAIEGTMGGGGIVDDGERLEVAMIGGCGHGGVAREEGHAFRQGMPPESPQPAAPPGRRERPKYRASADLMRRTFETDVLACPRCGGRMVVLATIEDPAVITRILTHLGLSLDPASPPRPARRPTRTRERRCENQTRAHERGGDAAPGRPSVLGTWLRRGAAAPRGTQRVFDGRAAA